ncbi:hypothetical protein WOLCODRAFT_144515 [Wolfiporia cocos MD-104 SS10]|uniref:SEC7 domain-containing protein n=1 Tax=Wolfiporia cocos (strain MD-104) TaxID=742152 RepID=A0A2H3JU26_WOLCO|nr:hypothetical protein WOLCODRAFT_144515 [Wolfiporia cocos MD-104 SS10]
MDPSSVAEQRAFAVAKLKRAASLPRMKDGRRPPMHVEAVSEGERVDNAGEIDEESAQESDGRQEGERGHELEQEQEQAREPEQEEEGPDQGIGAEPPIQDAAQEEHESPPPQTPVAPETTATRTKRRSRSRTRSRGSRDMKNVKSTVKQSSQGSSANQTNESSADEYTTSGPGDDPPPSPPLVSPIPSHYPLPARMLSPFHPPFFYQGTYPGTTPSTPLPTLDDLSRGIGIGLRRSNSAGPARAMAMHKLTGGREPLDPYSMSSSPTPPPGMPHLQRNNTVSGGERLAAREMLLHRLNNRIKEADSEQTSGGERAYTPIIHSKRRQRRSKRASSRASTVVDDREERDPPSTSPTTPIVSASPLPPPFSRTPEPPRPSSSLNRIASGDAARASPSARTNGSLPIDYEKPTGHRGVVVEDEDDLPECVTPQHPLPPSTPNRGHGLRLPHTADSSPSHLADSSATVARTHVMHTSPFATPIKEKAYLDDEDEEFEEQRAQSRSRLGTRDLSWVSNADPDLRMPYDEDEDSDEDDDIPERVPDGDATDEMPDQHDNSDTYPPPRQNLIIETETSLEPNSAHMTPSPVSPTVPLAAALDEASVSSVTYPTRLSVATPSQLERSPSGAEWPLDENRSTVTDATLKRSGGESAWGKMMNMVRRGSVNGRRSRADSIGIRDRRDHTDSSISRESRNSISKEKAEQQDTQPPSASTSILSLPIAPQISALSPVPPATQADMITYNFDSNSKLFPFPKLLDKMEEQRRRGMAASTPDVTSQNGLAMESMPSSASSNTATRLPESGRERKLSHQVSDSRLLAKFTSTSPAPPMSSVPSSTSQNGDYFTIQPTSSTGVSASSPSKLPTTREGVKKWLKKWSTQPTSQTPPMISPSNSGSPPADGRPRIGEKKASLSDLWTRRKEVELASDWAELSYEKSRTPTNANAGGNGDVGKPWAEEVKSPDTILDNEAFADHSVSPETVQSPRPEYSLGARTNGVISPSQGSEYPSSIPSPPEPPSSTTPDPQSSLDDYPTRSTSFSDSLSSHPSPHAPSHELSVRSIVFDRLEEVLGRGSKSSLPMEDPLRKLLLSSPVLQVVNSNTVKDRFLFLFNDILVIAKPIIQDQDVLLEIKKPSPLDRKFVIKSVCQLRDLRFSGDRDDCRSKVPGTSTPTRHPIMQSFVHQFSRDPDSAIAGLLSKTSASVRDDPVALGQLLFRTLDLDKARLGEYLSRRSSKAVFKAFVDNFGFTGHRIDKSLRVFLQAVNIPQKPGGQSGSSDYLLDSFASRWYDANASIVAYDRDLAIRLVRAIVQLNEVMHGAITQEPGQTGYPLRNVLSGDFVGAFRRFDFRGLVADDLLDKVYTSIRKEKLSHARGPAVAVEQPDILVTIKRPLPSRLTYRVQSDPIIFRIPQPDPHLTIQLYGQDLIFEPSTLSFARSAEASFRVTGHSLGSKTIIMLKCGPRSVLYTGLPPSSPVVVERAFMRNTFQVAFENHKGAKRKYMFSVDDPLLRSHWTVSLKQHIDAMSSSPLLAGIDPSPSTMRKASEALAFKVLQEKLIDTDDDDSATPMSPIEQTYARLVGAPQIRANGSASAYRPGSTAPLGGSRSPRRRPDGSSAHVRSKSRSQVYHRHGPGKLEMELSDSTDPRTDEERLQSESLQSQQQRLWSARDLEIVCRQNSMIAPLLAYLQVDRRDHDMSDGAVS